MTKFTVAAIFWLFAFAPAQAQISENLDRLSLALGLPQVIVVMQQEGVDYADELADSMFPGRGGDAWRQTVADIYNLDRMNELALGGFGEGLDEADITALTDFFESDIGVEIITLEISARRALMDEAVDEDNKANTASMIAGGHPRIALIKQFIEVNDLLEINVVGALNSNFAFYTGLVDGGAYDEPITEERILTDVYEQEPEIRVDTSEWLYGFLTLAYSPLSDADLRAYIAFSETDAGQALNTALFTGFDELFDAISHDLGLAAARIMASEEL